MSIYLLSVLSIPALETFTCVVVVSYNDVSALSTVDPVTMNYTNGAAEVDAE